MGLSACSKFSPSPYPELILVGKDAQIEWVSYSTCCNVQLLMCKNTGAKEDSTPPQAPTLAFIDSHHKRDRSFFSINALQ